MKFKFVINNTTTRKATIVRSNDCAVTDVNYDVQDLHIPHVVEDTDDIATFIIYIENQYETASGLADLVIKDQIVTINTSGSRISYNTLSLRPLVFEDIPRLVLTELFKHTASPPDNEALRSFNFRYFQYLFNPESTDTTNLNDQDWLDAYTLKTTESQNHYNQLVNYIKQLNNESFNRLVNVLCRPKVNNQLALKVLYLLEYPFRKEYFIS